MEPGTNAVADWEARLEILRWKVPPQTNGVIDLGSALGKFFRQALECVDSEVEGVMQEVIALLTSDGGLLRIEELLKQPFETFRSLRLDQILSDQLIPFFAIFTRRNVISSSMLRAKATAAYNFIYTSDGDGSHVIKLFAALATHFSNAIITDASSHHGKIDNLDTLSAVGTTIAFFSMLIELNTSAYANPGFLPIAETFAAILNSLPVYAMIEANKNLAQLQHRLSFGQALSNARAVETSSGARAAFHGPREMPGELSYKGRRHDNDHADIREISILPTLQEIQSSRSEYLPFADPRQWHLGGIAGLVDRHFRLLREDTVGQLRDATKLELEKLQNPRTSVDCSDLESQGARTHVYENAYIAAIACDQYQGPQIAMGFTRPKANCQESEAARKDWWTSSKRLMSDALICLLSSEGSATFFVVAPERQNSSRLQRDYQLVSDHEHAYVVAKPVHLSDLHRLVPQAIGMTAITQRSIVEFPRVLLPFFQPTLQAMQRIVERADIPFSDILAPVPSYVNSDRKIEVGPPTFATKPGFRYDLSSITSSKEHLYFSRTDSIEHTAALLAQKSTLDLGQAEAVVASLTRSVALVQGPPGTGKSYTGMQLIRVLLSNKSRTEIGPILVCCQTNHALDTVLERAIDDNISHVVRIGGGSKSERLKCMNLRVLANQLDLTKEEKSLYWELKQKIQGEAARISELLNAFASLKTEAAVENHLAVNYPIHHEQLFGGIHEDAYTQPRRHKGTKIEEWLHQDYHPSPLHSRSIAELRNVNIHSMTSPERRLTLDSWVTELEDELHEKFRHALSSYEAAQEQLKIMQMELNLRVLRRTNIIGVTTNGLARHLDLLGAVNIDILLCEEAGEVLEAHSLTGLLPSIKQFILIGDHQQLRPQIQDYNLSTESPNGVGYGLDISLFERLIHPRDTSAQPLPFSTLHLQRRMHPSISQLIRTTQYPHLQDDLCVSRYPEIVGMRHRLFWLDHEAPEDHTEAPSTSRSNAFEVDMIAALVQHIVHQGVYNAADIAVLTPYSGQLRKLRDRFSDTYTILLNDRDADELDEDAAATEDASCVRSMAGTHKAAQGSLNQALRLATVDNFQGEEAKIVIVSLVRSNKQNNPGFLRTPNRINVLLSRAQHGMYILGNTNTMESVPMWHDVITIFRENGSIAMQADWVTFTAYKDIDLDVGPCVFTPCGHIFTIDSLDSTMGMHEYYEVDPLTGEYSELKTSAEPFSISEPKSCPECRGSLRNLARYGRIVRRALLDESTKKLTAWSSRMHHQLVKHLAGFEAELMDTLEFPQKPTQTITLNGTKQAQIDTIKRLKTADRYRKMFQLIDGITNFGSKLSQAEQTYQRVHDLVEMVRRQGSSCATIAAADVSSEELQVHEHLRAGNLLVRSYLVLLADVVAVQFKTPINSQGVLQVDFTAWREQCDELIAEAGASNNTRQATEAQVLWAKLAAVECGISQVVTQGTDFFESVRMEVLEDDAIERLEAVEQICARQAQRSTAYRDLLRHERPDLVGDEEKHPMAGLVDEAAEVREMLNHGLSRTGTRMVVTAAAEESHGTGHWYRCVNGHPFTVGERGVPMQFSLCPECGAGVGGGEDHEPMEGVTYARDIEEDAMDVGAMEI
ncbi:hypothetical protein MBLNU459_g5523t2 [Dothideomycetes sp. NU459]